MHKLSGLLGSTLALQVFFQILGCMLSQLLLSFRFARLVTVHALTTYTKFQIRQAKVAAQTHDFR